MSTAKAPAVPSGRICKKIKTNMLLIYMLLSYTVSQMSHLLVHSGASAGKPLRPFKPSGLTSLAMLGRVCSDNFALR